MSTNINYYNAIIAGGTADAMTATVVPAQTVLLMDILPLWVRVPGTNATTTPTITINGVTTNITLRDGSTVAAGDLQGTVILSKNSGQNRYELLTPASGGAGAVSSVNGQTGVVVLDAGDVGADPSGSAAAAQAASVSLAGSYANPSWIASLAWSKITGTPTTISGYGITNIPYDQSYYFALGDALYDGWIGPFTENFNPVTVSIARDFLFGMPFHVSRGVNIDKIGIEVTGAGTAGSVIRLGVYADDGTGKPGALLLDAGTVTGDSNAVKTITLGANLPLPNGKYYLVMIHNSVANITVRAISGTGGASAAYRGLNINSFTSGAPNRYTAPLVYPGSLPDPFTTAGLVCQNATIPCPMLHPNSFL